jgi:lysozyme family protein
MTEDDLIDGVLEREQGFADHPNDRGGPTKFGITAQTLGLWRKLGRQATRAEVLALGTEEARAIYRARYIHDPGFDAIAYPPLRAQVIDDGVLSGPHEAIQTLQEVLGVPADGVFGPRTRAFLATKDQAVVHVRYLKARLERYAVIVRDNRSQGDFIHGWVLRALAFIDDNGRPCA